MNQKQLLKLFLKDLRNLREYRRDIPFALTTAMELSLGQPCPLPDRKSLARQS